jgi:3-phytase
MASSTSRPWGQNAGLRKYHADPDAEDPDVELAFFGTEGYTGDREGLAILTTGPETGYLVSTDQIEGGSRYLLYAREGTPADTHDHSTVIAVLEGSADDTDGIEAVPGAFGPEFPNGLLVAMNSTRRRFLLFNWPTDAPGDLMAPGDSVTERSS